MAAVFRGVDLHSAANNREHRTHEISVQELVVRRGKPFRLTLTLSEPFDPDLHPLTITAATGKQPSEASGTMWRFGVPDTVETPPSAKARWRAQLQGGSPPPTATLTLNVHPSAHSPVGEYRLSARLRGEEEALGGLVLLFNPWCPEDSVFLSDEKEKQEYVLNERGVIYRGSADYISSMYWDYGQFEEDMAKICLRILDVNNENLRDPAGDAAARRDPVYVGRVISAMINSQDDYGVLQGRWGSDYWGGVPPTRWNGSYAILRRWFDSGCRPVKYGQCWVFAGVMCSVLRLLGIPCRVVSNFQSAHDTNGNLTIDSHFSEEGFRELESRDSIWNFHVWVEGWMKRPDLGADGKYDGWQVLDPTPQETSDGVYCCGPAPVAAILNGDTHLEYDVPFVFAEVNADRVFWLVRKDGSKMRIFSDPSAIGRNTSTKSVGSTKRLDITNTYKYTEGTVLERMVFQYALIGVEGGWRLRGNAEALEINGPAAMNAPRMERNRVGEPVANSSESPEAPTPQLLLAFEEVSKPLKGEDVQMRLWLKNDSPQLRELSFTLSVQAMRYNGTPAGKIQVEETERKVEPHKDLSIPVVVPYSSYRDLMVPNGSMNFSAVVTEKGAPDGVFMAVHCVALENPPISIKVSSPCRVGTETSAEVVFMNPIDGTLTDCCLTVSGSGLFKKETTFRLPDLRPNVWVRVKFFFVPYKSGERSLLIDFDCSSFRDMKESCSVTVKP
ncbi:protein-glutamine gamma-glutamyltransferase 2-like [Menidia menidia]